MLTEAFGQSQLSGRGGYPGEMQLWWERRHIILTTLVPFTPEPPRTTDGHKARHPVYSHSMMRGLGTSHLKRVVYKMPQGQGKLFTNSKLFPHPSGKRPWKMQAGKALHQPSAQSSPNPDARPDPGRQRRAPAESATRPRAGPRSRPGPRFLPESGEAGRAGGLRIQTPPPSSGPLRSQPSSQGCPGFCGGDRAKEENSGRAGSPARTGPPRVHPPSPAPLPGPCTPSTWLIRK